MALVVAAAAAGEALRVVVQSAGERMWERITELTTTTATVPAIHFPTITCACVVFER